MVKFEISEKEHKRRIHTITAIMRTMQDRNKFSVVGKSVPAKDAKEKVAGTLQYAVDFSLPGMVHGKILRSTSLCN